MKKLKLLLILPFLYACSEACSGIDCLSENYFLFTIKSAENGEDLIFGAEPEISEDEISVFYMENGERSDIEPRVQQEALPVSLNEEIKELYVSALGKTDTVKVDLKQMEVTKCCPATFEIQTIYVNGKPLGKSFEVLELYR